MLSNLNILDFTSTLPGPYTTMVLADLGANVLRIQNPDRPDIVNILEPKIDNRSAVFDYLNRNKGIVNLDLTDENNQKQIKHLIRKYDIIIEGNRPGVMQKLNLNYEELQKINPKIIYLSLTGYGQNGSYKDRAGHDINYLALSGVASIIKNNENEPILPGIQIADLMGSMYSISSLLSAVIYRNQTGKGQYIDVSMRDAVMSLAALHLPMVLMTETDQEIKDHILSGGTYYGYYQTKDDKYISIGALERKFFTKLCEILKIEQSDHRFRDKQIRTKIAEKIKSKPLNYWIDKFQNEDICVEPVINLREAVNHPNTIGRHKIIDVEIRGKIQRQLSHPVKYSEYDPKYDELQIKNSDDVFRK